MSKVEEAITTVEQGVEFIKNNATIKENVDSNGNITGTTATLQKSAAKKFLASAGASEQVVKVYNAAHDLLTKSLFKVCADKTIEIAKQSKDKVKPTEMKTYGKVFLDETNLQLQINACATGKNPRTGEPITTWFQVRTREDCKKKITTDDIETYSKAMEEILKA